MKQMSLLFTTAVFFMFSSCRSGYTNIYELSHLSEINESHFEDNNSGLLSKTSQSQFFIVANLPSKDPKTIFEKIKEFNQKTLRIDSFDSDLTTVTRRFYLETSKLNKSLMNDEDGFLSNKDIAHHKKEKIAHCTWTIRNGEIHGHYFIYVDGSKVSSQQVRSI